MGNVSSGNFEERWSSIATTMARVTRSGTLVGPGTKRKWRPAIISPPFVCRVSLLTKPLAKAQPPWPRQDFPFIDHDFQNGNRVCTRRVGAKSGGFVHSRSFPDHDHFNLS